MFFQNETFGKTKLFPKKNLVPGVGWGGGGGAGIEHNIHRKRFTVKRVKVVNIIFFTIYHLSEFFIDKSPQHSLSLQSFKLSESHPRPVTLKTIILQNVSLLHKVLCSTNHSMCHTFNSAVLGISTS